MKIVRPSHAQPPVSPSKAPGITGAKGKEFAASLDRAERTAAATSGPEKSAGTHQASAVASIGAELKAGKLTPEAAIDKVVEQILDRQLGKTTTPALRAQLAAALRDSLADDPHLAAKVRALSRE